MDKHVHERIIKCLQDVRLATIATCEVDTPWVATVWFVFDDDLRLYFLSPPSSRHGRHLENNERIAVAAHSQRFVWGQDLAGVQMVGKATIVGMADIPRILKLYLRRFPEAVERLTSPKVFSQATFRSRFYQIDPIEIKCFDEEAFGKGESRTVTFGETA